MEDGERRVKGEAEYEREYSEGNTINIGSPSWGLS